MGADQPATHGPLDVPGRTVPVPNTVSAQLQTLIAVTPNPNWNVSPVDWKAASAPKAGSGLAELRERLGVVSEAMTLDGVTAYMVTPKTIPAENRDQLVIQFHSGCYVWGGGESGSREAIFLAGFGHMKVLAVDYRRPPEFPYPAALDDGVTVWKAALRTTDAKKMAVCGVSAGGALALSLVLRLKQEKLPLPGAIASGSPMADLTGAGDSFQTNAMVDNVLVASPGFCDDAGAQYANGHDLTDPLLSPVYGDMVGMPPAILTSGTRDLLLSSTVRVHRKLRQAGVPAELHVYEGQSHAQFQFDADAPETKEAFEEIASFFRKHLEA